MYRCTICGDTFTSQRGLNEHVVEAHGEGVRRMGRNNWTGEHSVHGPQRPQGWEQRLEAEIIGRKPGE